MNPSRKKYLVMPPADKIKLWGEDKTYELSATDSKADVKRKVA